MTTTVTIKAWPAAPYQSAVAVIHEKDPAGNDVVREHVLMYGSEYVFNLHGEQRLTVVESKLLVVGGVVHAPPMEAAPRARLDARDYHKDHGPIRDRNDPGPFFEDVDPA